MDNLNKKLRQDKATQTDSKAPDNGLSNKRQRSNSQESEPMEIDSCDNVPNPLKMGSILELIFGFMDVKSIKAARLMNELWSVEGAKILMTKCYVKIPSDLVNADSSKIDETMNKFKAFLAYKSSNFSMLPKVTVTGVADFKLWKSLGVLGPQVNSLKLLSIKDGGELLQKLLDLLPNLKYLNLTIEPKGDEGIDMLQTLCSTMSKPEKEGNPLVIRQLIVVPENVKEFEELEKFSECKNINFEGLRFGAMRFSTFYVSQYETRVAVILSKLLSASQSTLKRLDFIFGKINLSLVQFPCIPTLIQLAMIFLDSTPVPLTPYKFSPCFRFAEKFPHLEHFYIYCQKMLSEANFLGDLFEKTGTAPSVKTLSCTESPAAVPVQLLFQHFPNTRRFNIEPSPYTKKTFHSVCKYGGNIEWLSISINLDQFGQNADLDSILTGFASETVGKIKNAPNGLIDDVEKLRVNPSILDLKELDLLDIFLDGTGLNFLPERTFAVAGEYAFKLMPKDAKIRIFLRDNTTSALAHARAALDEVCKLPNVTACLLTEAWLKTNF